MDITPNINNVNAIYWLMSAFKINGSLVIVHNHQVLYGKYIFINHANEDITKNSNTIPLDFPGNHGNIQRIKKMESVEKNKKLCPEGR